MGTMGTPMVLNLLKGGFHVTVYSAHLDSPNVRLAASKGAAVARSAEEVAEDSEVALMCLPRAEVSEKVLLGERGLLAGSAPGTIIVEMSTVPPLTVKRFGREAGRRRVKVLDAPISGGRTGAEAGTLTIMVGGDRRSFQRCLPVFGAVGKMVYHLGGLGAGETMKLVNGMVGNANLMAALEGLELASKAGMDLKLVQGIVANSTGQSWAWNTLVPRILDAKNVGVNLDTLAKDVGYVLALADEVGAEARIAREASAVLARLRRETGGSTDVSSAFPSLLEPVRPSRGGRRAPRRDAD